MDEEEQHDGIWGGRGKKEAIDDESELVLQDGDAFDNGDEGLHPVLAMLSIALAC